MRYPEAEEHCVVGAFRSPGEEIGFDESHRFVPVPSTRPGQHLRCGVYGGDGCFQKSEGVGSKTRAASEVPPNAPWAQTVGRREQIIQNHEMQKRGDTRVRV